jgi:membrane fusion protein, multidrug efflux system
MNVHSHSWLRRLAQASALAATCVVLSSCGGDKGPPQPQTPEVGVVTLKAEPVTLKVELAGRTHAYAQSEVRPQVSGIIRRRAFTEGAWVRAGQVLYMIDDATYVAAAEQAAASLSSAQANVEAARLKSERYQALARTNAVSRQEADDAKAAYGQATAAVQQARAQLKSARVNLGYTRLTAPISGRIGRSSVTEGALVTANQTEALAIIQRLDPMYVDIAQASAEILRLRKQLADAGQMNSAAVRLILPDGSEYDQTGALQFTEQTVDEATGTVTLRATFPNPNGLLLPGMYVRSVVSEGVQRNAILAPQQGITRDARGQATAMVVNAQGKAEPRVVVAGQAVGDKWLITSGLAPGDRLIVEGLMNARPGQPVRAVPAGSAAKSAAPASAQPKR